MEPWTLYFDGLTEPRNPGGRMCWGFVLIEPGKDDFEGRGTRAPHPANTNNIAEYSALGFGLRAATGRLAGVKDFPGLVIRGDSQLVVNQINDQWRINKEHLRKLHARCHELLAVVNQLGPWHCEWIPREQNDRADQLSRLAYHDAEGKWPPERQKAVR